jgi:hypothetical protein
MSGELIDLATVAALVGAVPDVPVLSMRVEHDDVDVHDEWRRYFRIVRVSIHAASMPDAELLLDRLGLVGDANRAWETEAKYGVGPLLWQAWTGWIATASDDLPVSVEVIASAEIPVEDPYDPATDPWSPERPAAEADRAGAVA